MYIKHLLNNNVSFMIFPQDETRVVYLCVKMPLFGQHKVAYLVFCFYSCWSCLFLQFTLLCYSHMFQINGRNEQKKEKKNNYTGVNIIDIWIDTPTAIKNIWNPCLCRREVQALTVSSLCALEASSFIVTLVKIE